MRRNGDVNPAMSIQGGSIFGVHFVLRKRPNLTHCEDARFNGFIGVDDEKH